jgi:serine/threonine protein kinase
MIPEKIGRYQLRGELGRGGMATVYRAYDPKFEREVALKVLPRELLHNPTFRARFEREAKIIATLDHPAIVPVYDFGEEDGQPFFVMRLMTDRSLAQHLEQGPLPLAEAIRILVRLAQGLAEAHKKGFIHRDVKPANILFDPQQTPYLSDFGLAKLASDGIDLTQSAIAGTPAYLSPEQARGEPLDGRTDVYSLGAIFYEMLTCGPPYWAPTPLGILIKHLNEPLPRLQALRPDLPPACDELLARALAKDRAERFPSADAFAEALSALPLEESPPREALLKERKKRSAETMDLSALGASELKASPAPEPTPGLTPAPAPEPKPAPGPAPRPKGSRPSAHRSRPRTLLALTSGIALFLWLDLPHQLIEPPAGQRAALQCHLTIEELDTAMAACLKLEVTSPEEARERAAEIKEIKAQFRQKHRAALERALKEAGPEALSRAREELELLARTFGEADPELSRLRKSYQLRKELGRRFRFDAAAGTVTDTKTGLMWATKDNGTNLSWSEAEAYCRKYSAGGYADWRLPSSAELKELYQARVSSYQEGNLIQLSECCSWSSEKKGDQASILYFTSGTLDLYPRDQNIGTRALPVRAVKKSKAR